MENVVLCHQGINSLRSPDHERPIFSPVPSIFTSCQQSLAVQIAQSFHRWVPCTLSHWISTSGHYQHFHTSSTAETVTGSTARLSSYLQWQHLGLAMWDSPIAVAWTQINRSTTKFALLNSSPYFPQRGSGCISETQAPRCIHKQ